MAKHIPNILTIIRFILIPFILKAVVSGNYLLAFIVLTISRINRYFRWIYCKKI